MHLAVARSSLHKNDGHKNQENAAADAHNEPELGRPRNGLGRFAERGRRKKEI
jgi:hypothetical protein